MSSWRSESNSKRREHSSPRERGSFVHIEEGHAFQGRRGFVQLKEGMIFKRRRGHVFPEIATLNAELTTVRKEVVQHCFRGHTTS
jgi:hypothetical protein